MSLVCSKSLRLISGPRDIVEAQGFLGPLKNVSLPLSFPWCVFFLFGGFGTEGIRVPARDGRALRGSAGRGRDWGKNM